MYRLFLTTLVICYFSCLGMGQVEKGKKIFDDNCSSCHSVGGGKIVGPDLKGVTGRRKEEWIKKFIQSSKTLIESGDPEAKAVFEENGKIQMPEHSHLKETDLNALIEFFKNSSVLVVESSKDSVVANKKSIETPQIEEKITSSIPTFLYVLLGILAILIVFILIIIYQLVKIIKNVTK